MSETTVQLPLRRAVRRWLRSAGTALAALLLVTCSSDSPVGPGRRGIGSLRVAPAFDAFARVAPLTLDNVRVIVVRPPAETLAVVPRPFNPNSNQLQLNIPVFLQSVSEDLLVTLELYSGQTLLFSGTRTLRVSQGAATPPDSIPVVYQGPGSQVTTLVISPRDTTISFGALLPYVANATDGQQQPVAQYYVSWSTPGAPAGTTIDGTGRLTAPSQRGTFFVKVATPNGVVDSTSVIISAAASTLVKVSGDGQSGIIGARLAQPLVVRVDGSDGLPVSGVPVTFAAALGGGSVDSATFLSDGAGLATMGATLGATVGAQSFTASAPGLASVTFTATGSGGSVKTWAGTVSSAWTTAGNWSPAAVPAAGDSVVIPAGAPNSPTLTGNSAIGALTILGNASNLTVAGNLTVARGISLADTNEFIQLNSGQLSAGAVALAGFQSFIDASAGAMQVSGASTISGDRAFIDARGGSNSFGAVVISGASAFMQQGGGTSSTITLTSSALWEATGPVVVTGAPALSVQGTASLSTTGSGPAPVQFNGDVLLGGADGRLIPNTPDAGFTINGNLILSGSGRLEMMQSTDTVRVTGNANFGGADETGSLTAGALFVAGNLSQTGVATSFVGTGSHTVFLNGSGTQTLNFASPGFGASRFQNVIIANSAGGVSATSDVYSTGTAGVTPTAVRTLSGNGSTLFTTILNVSNFTFNNLLLNFAGSTVVTFDTVTFQGYAPTATPLTITHPGAASPLPFLKVTFTVVPSSGFYLNATDSNLSDGVPLVIDMLNPSPLSGGSFVLTSGATVNWPSGAAPGTWTGAVDTSWNTAGNWSDGNVPTGTTDVTVPAGTPFSPATSGAVRQVRNLTVLSGATLAMGGGGLSVNGSLDAPGLITGNVASFVLAGTGTARGNVAGTFFSTTVNGSYTLNGRLVTPGLTINGQLDLAGFTAVVGSSVGDDFQTVNNGVLVMTNALDSLIVGGAGPSITFTGGSTVGKLTSGVILVNSTGVAGFTQDNIFNDSSYAPSGTHKLVTGATSTMLLSMATPGTGSHFNILDLSAQTGGVTLQTPIRVNGLLISTPASTAPAINGSNRTVTAAGGTQITGLTLTNTPVVLSGGSSLQFDNVTFQSMSTAATQLTVDNVGATPFTFNNLVFSTVPTSGRYLAANDPDGATSGVLTVNLVNAAPATPGGFITQTGGAVINWPPAGSLSWTGAVSTNWNTAGNWSTGTVPTNVDDVTIPSAPTNQPIVTTSCSAKSLTVNVGASLSLGAINCQVGGDVFADGSITGSGAIQIATTAQLRGNIPNLIVSGPVTVVGRTVLAGNATISNGSLTLGGHTITVAGSLTTQGTGVIGMTNALDSMIVAGAGSFGGGDESASLTAGYLKLGGSFGQSSANSAASFAASGTHRTEMGAGAIRVINFATPGAGAGTSHFNDLIVNGAAGGINIANNTFINGQLISHPVTTTPVIGVVSGPKVLTVGGVDVSALGVDQHVMTIGAGTITQFDNVAFTGQANAVTQLTINNPGTVAALTFNGLSFGVAPTTGLYLAANDLDGATPNALTINVNGASPAAPSPSLFSASNGAVVNWPPATPPLTWTGAVSTDWSVAGNWSPAQVPTAANDVVIPAFTPIATVTSSCAAKSLNVTGQLSLGTFNCQVQGNVLAGGVIAGTTGAVVIQGAGQIQGNIPNLVINAPVTVVGATGLGAGNGNVTISGAGASLTMNGQTLVMPGNLVVQSGGLLVMTNPADVLTVQGDAAFDGGNELGSLSAGVLSIAGNLTQLATTSPDAFHTSGTHLTVFLGASPTLSFATPGNVPGTSHFEQFRWTGTGIMTLASDVFAHGAMDGSPGVSGTIASINHTLQVGEFMSGGVTFNGTALVIDQPLGTPIGFANATFISMSSTVNQLTVNHPGTGGPFSFSNLTFSSTPTTGFYLSATDLNASDGVPLTIDVTGSSPATGTPFVQQLNGAVVNWPPAGGGTWTGATSTDWNTGSNWSSGIVPTATDNVVIPAGTLNAPVVNNSVTINNLTVAAGATLSTNDISFDVNGVINFAGSFVGCCGDFIGLNGGGTIRGSFDQVALNLGAGSVVTLTGATTLTSSSVTINGELILGGHTLNLGQGTLNTSNGTGVLTMTNPADQVVAGVMDFSGGDETGRLTAGVIQTRILTQGSGGIQHPASFFASGNHTVILSGAFGSSVTFFNPTTSRFQNLDVTGVAPTLQLQSNLTVAGQLISLPSSGNGPTIQGTGVTLTAGGADIAATASFTALTMDTVPLVLSGGTISAFSDVTFQNQNPLGIHLTVNNVGQGSPYTFGNLVFTTGLSAGGLYIQANDLDGATSNGPLTIDVLGATPPSGAGVSQANNGAVINWPPTGGTITWAGTTSSDWSLASNWTGSVVPGITENVVVPSGTPFAPVLTTNVTMNDLTITPGATVDVATFGLGVNGSLDNGGTITTSSNGILALSGTGGKLLRGTVNADVTMAPAASYVLNGRLTLTSPHILVLSGILDLGGHTAAVTSLAVNTATGQLRMLSSADSMIVADIASFDGGSTAGVLTAGVLTVGGDFIQLNTQSTESFQASGTHKTVLNGVGLGQILTFFSPGAGSNSRFQTLEVATTGGGSAALGTGVTAGDVTVTSPGGLDLGGHTLTASSTFSTSGNGILTMLGSSDSLLVGTDVSFAGGSTAGTMTDGVVRIGGNFKQIASTDVASYAPSGLHKTVFVSPSARSIDFGSPGSGTGGSHFQVLDLSGATGGVSLTVNSIADSVISTNAAAKLVGGGSSLTMRRAQVTGLVVDNAPIILNEQLVFQTEVFSNVTFQGFPTTGTTMFRFLGPGGTLSARPAITTNNVNFQSLPIGAGNLYMDVTSTNAGFVTFTMNGSNQSPLPPINGNGPTNSNPANQQRVSGALVSWP